MHDAFATFLLSADAGAAVAGLCFGLAVLILGALLYFLPCIVASRRQVANISGIVLLNVLLGWTVLGWLGALLWACSAETKAQVQLREYAFAQMARGGYPPQPPPAN